MSKQDIPEVDPRQVIADAIARGVSAEDQFNLFDAACMKCAEASGKRLFPNFDADQRCMNACKIAGIISANEAEIDAALFPDTTNHSPVRPDQAESDKLYDRKYWQSAGKSDDEIAKELDHLYGKPMNLVRLAWRAALSDQLHKRPYNPRVLDPNPPTPPPRDPYFGDQRMRSMSSAAGTGHSRNPVEALMPVSSYWTVETAKGTTLHIVGECPASPVEQADVQELEEAMHPMQIADDLGASVCGTCLRMLQANEKDGFLFGSVTSWRTFTIWQDRIEYEKPGFVWGIGATRLVVNAQDIESVAFPSPTKLVLVVPEHGEISVSFDRAAEGDVACEALRRQGWSFDD